jgi:reactive chlorine resistance protein C
MQQSQSFNPTIAKAPSGAALTFQRVGRAVALIGAIAPLLLIGGMKFTQVEIEGLRPLIGGTPWLAWMYTVFGEAGASYLLGLVEIATALLLILSPWSARAGILGGAIAVFTFLVTCSIMFVLPIWDQTLGFPALGPLGQFLIKDIALLGISLVVLGEGLGRRDRT